MNAKPDEKPIGILYAWHLALVTNRIHDCTQRLWNDLGIGPWQYVTFEFPEADARVNGRHTQFRVSAAITQVGFLTLGFDQPLTELNPYSDMLRRREGGAHHMAFAVPDEDYARARMRDFGYAEILTADRIGPKGEGAAGYFDTVEDLGTVIELSKVPSDMPSVTNVFPVDGGAKRSGTIQVRGTSHIVIAVRDVERAARSYERILGVGPWTVTTFNTPGHHLDKKIEYTVKRARAQVGEYVLLLEQPLSASGPLQDFLRTNGQGIHRIGFCVDDVQECSKELQRLGHVQVFRSEPTGLQGKPDAVYFDTDRVFGTMIELTAKSVG